MLESKYRHFLVKFIIFNNNQSLYDSGGWMLSQACIISYNSISISHLNARFFFFFFFPYRISIEGNNSFIVWEILTDIP